MAKSPDRRAAKAKGRGVATYSRCEGAQTEDRKMAKTSSRNVAASSARVKTAVTISAEAYRRLRAACAGGGPGAGRVDRVDDQPHAFGVCGIGSR